MRRKARAIQNLEYKQAMQVADYNAGRTVSDISNKTYVHGTRKYLRPDTLWADERYTQVTQAEIVEAKVRHEARLAQLAPTSTPAAPEHHVDHSAAFLGSEDKLYF